MYSKAKERMKKVESGTTIIGAIYPREELSGGDIVIFAADRLATFPFYDYHIKALYPVEKLYTLGKNIIIGYGGNSSDIQRFHKQVHSFTMRQRRRLGGEISLLSLVEFISSELEKNVRKEKEENNPDTIPEYNLEVLVGGLDTSTKKGRIIGIDLDGCIHYTPESIGMYAAGSGYLFAGATIQGNINEYQQLIKKPADDTSIRELKKLILKSLRASEEMHTFSGRGADIITLMYIDKDTLRFKREVIEDLDKYLKEG